MAARANRIPGRAAGPLPGPGGDRAATAGPATRSAVRRTGRSLGDRSRPWRAAGHGGHLLRTWRQTRPAVRGRRVARAARLRCLTGAVQLPSGGKGVPRRGCLRAERRHQVPSSPASPSTLRPLAANARASPRTNPVAGQPGQAGSQPRPPPAGVAGRPLGRHAGPARGGKHRGGARGYRRGGRKQQPAPASGRRPPPMARPTRRTPTVTPTRSRLPPRRRPPKRQ